MSGNYKKLPYLNEITKRKFCVSKKNMGLCLYILLKLTDAPLILLNKMQYVVCTALYKKLRMSDSPVKMWSTDSLESEIMHGNEKYGE